MNRNQAKILAPIVTAFAAGSIIQARHTKYSDGKWVRADGKEYADLEGLVTSGWELRIAPKPPKKQICNIGLFNIGQDGNWIPGYVLVPKHQTKTAAHANGFVRWLAENVELKRNETGVKAQEVRHA